MKIIAVEIRGSVKVVLTQGANVGNWGDYAAYIGTSEESDYAIAGTGAKLRKREALAFFPNHLKSEEELRS